MATAMQNPLNCTNKKIKPNSSSPQKNTAWSVWPTWGLCGPILWASCICGLSHFFAILWTVVHQAPLCMGFSRQEYWSGLPCPLPGDLPDLGMEPVSVISPALANGFFTTSTTWEVHCGLHIQVFKYICVCVCVYIYIYIYIYICKYM